MENQLELRDEIHQQLDKLQQALPRVETARAALKDEVYQDGALSAKVKRLIAMAVALRAACAGCIIGQTKQAVDAGATRDEVFETISVVAAMSGSTGVTESYRVIKLLEELGK